MTDSRIHGPAQLVLLASIARRYYLDGRSKVEIAEEFSLSRFKVARLLETAHEAGVVRIEIGYPSSVDLDLSARLRHAFGLLHAVVVATSEEDNASLRAQVGAAAAELLAEIVGPDDVLGLGWARSLIAMRGALTRLAPCSVVQLTGALSRPDVDESSIELVRDVARIAKGRAFYFYAPMIVPDAATAAALLRQPEVVQATSRFGSVTKAVVGIGGWDPPHSTMYDAIPPPERAALVELGVRADVSGVLLDAEGRAVRAPVAQRVIGVDAAQLREIPEVIGLAYGPEKAHAARAAILGGYVQGLVTHSSFARALLQATG